MASPYGLDLPGDFDEDQAAIDRRKLQLIAAMKTPIGGAGSGLIGGIGNFLQNAVGTNLLTGEDARARNLAGQRADFARQALEDYGKLDKPAVPQVVGTGPIAPPPGTPGVEAPTPQSSMPAEGQVGPPEPIPAEAGWLGGGMVPKGAEFTPNRAAQPMIPGAMSDKLTALSRVAQGGPLYAKIADKAMTQILEAPEKEAARKAATEDRAALAREAAAERAHQAELKRIEDARLDEHRRADRELEKEKDRIAAKERADNAATTRMAIVQAGQSGRASAELPPETLKFIAERVLAGDTSATTALGYGNAGAANRAAVQNHVAALAAERNMSPADVAAKTAEFFGIKAGERTAGVRTANVEMAVSEASKMANLVTEASAAFPRTDFAPVNKAIQAFEKNTGDPKVRQFGAAINSFVNAYARAISPVGGGTVSDKEHARDMLSTADSHEQVLGIIAQLQKEMEAARSAPADVRAHLRGAVTGTPAPTAPAAVAPTAGPKAGDVKSGYRFKGGDPSVKSNWEKV